MAQRTEDKGNPGGSVVRFTLGYDGAGRLKHRFTNGDSASARASVFHAYDADGQLKDRTVMSRSTTQTTVYSEYFTYDGRGKKLTATSTSDLSDIASDAWETMYDGIGSLIGTVRHRNGNPTVDVNTVDALGNVLKRISDSTISVQPKHVDFSIVGDEIVRATRPPYVLLGEAPDTTIFDTIYESDINGHLEKEERLVWKVQLNPPSGTIPNFSQDAKTGHTYARYTYGVDNKLRYAQKTWYDADSSRRTLFSEYRYDALGRRILVRTRRDTLCSGTEYRCQSTIERYIWDGDQLLAELRRNGANNQTEEQLNLESTDGSSYRGWVRYTHAGGIDEPVAVWASNSQVYGIVPHLSWRGNFEAGLDIETGVLLEDGGTPPWIWPNRYKDINLAPELRIPNPEPTRWLGSLIEGQIDLNGLVYRRNRYYNPTTARFTSEDPIGLAGGLNLYGFADGDPVNFSDPFGLCAGPLAGICVRIAVAALANLPAVVRATTSALTGLDGDDARALSEVGKRAGRHGGLTPAERLLELRMSLRKPVMER